MERVERVSANAFRSMHPEGVAELPGATALRIPAAHSSPMLNRIVGLGIGAPATEEQLDAAIAAMSGLRYYVSLSPAARPLEIGDWLLARGFESSWGWMQFRRGVAAVNGAMTSLTIAEIGPERSAEFARLLCTAYGLPEAVEPITAALPGRPGWHCWLALEGDEPAGAAALYVSGETGSDPSRSGSDPSRTGSGPGHAEGGTDHAEGGPGHAEPAGYLGLAGTAPEHRGKGAQSALLAVRIARARALGCDAVYTETGEQLPDRPSASYRNIIRAGFEELYVLPNWLSPAAG